MQRKIITYPSKRLYLNSEPIRSFNEDLHTLLDDMYETMIAGQGVGLAAIQVNVPVRVFLANIPDENEEQKKENLLEIINPELEFINDEKILFTEGCLSIPGFYEEVERYKSVALHYQDRFGKKHSLEASDFLAVVFQHEFDHLNGHLFIEKLSYSQRQKFQKEFKEAQKLAKKVKNEKTQMPKS
ncbi:peptide deformylase [Campylobacter sp. MIT 12-8780]|uniref:peptide deformylase n=1 Tax=Campylobacter sp. MIT 12-8780 TaxID=2202200 RepID=UPI00115C4813|nr:peptide deformylase [Campylobacter sp. MIT 12-8780]TQR41552.1 peptide deformylase [Campylobacter sp. MIT 12-8780]